MTFKPCSTLESVLLESVLGLLSSTARPDEVDAADFDAIYFTGGHAVMWDFPESEGLQRLARAIHERGGVMSPAFRGGRKCWPGLPQGCPSMPRKR